MHAGPGFFPAEMVFTERAIPVLVSQGIEWVIVANNHISRACKVSSLILLLYDLHKVNLFSVSLSLSLSLSLPPSLPPSLTHSLSLSLSYSLVRLHFFLCSPTCRTG